MPDQLVPYVILSAAVIGLCVFCLAVGAALDVGRRRLPVAEQYFPPAPPASAYRQFDQGTSWRGSRGNRVEVLRAAPRPRASIV
jgi:hypothetical protein